MDEWMLRVKATISTIGETKPTTAALISQQLHRYTQCGTRDDGSSLELALGIPIPQQLQLPRGGGRLLGGMLAEEGAGIAVEIIKGTIRLIVDGNKRDIDEQCDKAAVPAEMDVCGETIRGDHLGPRRRSKGVRNWDTLGMKRYHLVAVGQGEFQADGVHYAGNFLDGKFHDLSGNAVFYIGDRLKYVGCFYHGKRRGRGILSRYDVALGDFYEHFVGEWRDDAPWTGQYFDQRHEKIVRVVKGELQRNRLRSGEGIHPPAPESAPAPAPAPTPLSPLSPAPLVRQPDSISLNDDLVNTSPILRRKLSDSSYVLNVRESIEVLSKCIEKGCERAAHAAGKSVVMLLGGTGAGKSTFVNFLAGLPLELRVKPGGLSPMITVRPPAEERVPMGHTNVSKTFIADLVCVNGLVLCDCPGFFDNRAEEIAIANAVNIRATMVKAASVSIVLLVNYHSLVAEKGMIWQEVLATFKTLFGSADGIVAHKESILVGVTHVPVGIADMGLENFKNAFKAEGSNEVVRSLADRVFIADPLGRYVPGGWSYEECIQHIQHLPAIPQPHRVFHTSLNLKELQKLSQMSEAMGEMIVAALVRREYGLAAARYRELELLSSIEHNGVERLLRKALNEIGLHFSALVDALKECCFDRDFAQAEAKYQELCVAVDQLREQDATSLCALVDLPKLKAFVQQRSDKYEAEERDKQQHDDALRAANLRIEELVRLLDEQRVRAERQLEELESTFRAQQSAMQARLKAVEHSHNEQVDLLRREYEQQLQMREETVRESVISGMEKQMQDRKELEREERDQLEREYAQKVKQLEAEKQSALSRLAEQEQHQLQVRLNQRQELEEEIRVLGDTMDTAMKTQPPPQPQQQQSTASPLTANAKIEWLIKQLQSVSSELRVEAVEELSTLASEDASAVESIILVGGVLCLANLLQDGSGEEKVAAAELLDLVVRNAEGSMQKYAGVCDECIPPLISMLYSEALSVRFAAITALCAIAESSDANAARILAENGASAVVAVIADRSTEEKVAAAAALEVLARGDAHGAIIECDAVPHLIDLITSGSEEAAVPAAETLQHLCRHSSASLAAILPELMSVLQMGASVNKLQTVWLLTELAGDSKCCERIAAEDAAAAVLTSLAQQGSAAEQVAARKALDTISKAGSSTFNSNNRAKKKIKAEKGAAGECIVA